MHLTLSCAPESLHRLCAKHNCLRQPRVLAYDGMNNQSSSAPAPSKHVFVHELSKQTAGAKVRFLCCVFGYDATNGHLQVEHAYPLNKIPTPKAVVDINLVLETIKGEILEHGRWFNVIGYVTGGQQTAGVPEKGIPEANLPRNLGDVLVQAVLIWDAGLMRVSEYEKTMEAQREAWKNTRLLRGDSF